MKCRDYGMRTTITLAAIVFVFVFSCGRHFIMGGDKVCSLHNRDEKFREIKKVFRLKFIEDGRIIGAQPIPPPQ